ncbi:MAG: ABC transporter substrate-binding protein [Candidatus Rokubacteria bacterium]|nr:ABC transporter substrate-binding protein [Candidatus Rokubacteria bacterium]
MNQRADRIGRREFLGGLGAAGLVGLRGGTAAAEPPPETPRIRLYKFPGLCLAPQYVAEELLRAEGFTDVQYLQFPEGGVGVYERLGAGDVDITQWFVAPSIVEIDRGLPIVLVAGVHIGCFELFGTDRVRAIRDLKGKTIAVPWRGPGQETFIATMLAYVGLDPRKDINFVVHPTAEAIRLFAAGEIDAFLGFPPVPQELRAKKIGHVVVNSAVDRPWSQYFCCLAAGNREFVRKHPVATKRAVRAILKADQVCALEPERAARAVVDRGFTKSYEYALQTMKDVPYGRWREFNPEDAVRFYALRLHEAGMIKSTPQKLIAQGTDWRFLNELKKELKG